MPGIAAPMPSFESSVRSSCRGLGWGRLLAAVVLVGTLGALAGGQSTEGPTLPAGPIEREAAGASEYLSDFVVFSGRDDGGRVLFAFDANRGRDGRSHKAEHFAVLFVEGRGWVDLEATVQFAGSAMDFAGQPAPIVPSGGLTRVSGHPLLGLSLEIPSRELRFESEAFVLGTDRRRGKEVFATGAAAAQLEFAGRTFEGQALYELCYLTSVNPLARTYPNLFGDGFHGLYMAVGEDFDGALRLHRSGGRLEDLIARECGLLVRGEDRQTPEAFGLDIRAGRLAGFFRWPSRYRTAWRVDEGPRHSVDVRVNSRETLINWGFGGVAVAVLEGELRSGDERKPLYGLALIVR
jgi:hypothetical protein